MKQEKATRDIPIIMIEKHCLKKLLLLIWRQESSYRRQMRFQYHFQYIAPLQEMVYFQMEIRPMQH